MNDDRAAPPGLSRDDAPRLLAFVASDEAASASAQPSAKITSSHSGPSMIGYVMLAAGALIALLLIVEVILFFERRNDKWGFYSR